MKPCIIYNGKLVEAGSAVIGADNRGLRYGEGLFETMKLVDGKVVLAALHFERLFSSLAALKFEVPPDFTPAYLQQQIAALCKKNKIAQAARVRLNVFRGNGGLYDPENLKPDFIIQAWPLQESNLALNEEGFIVDVYPDARKSCDAFSNLKSNNYLPYVMAALYAQQNTLNDALLLNVHGRICDASIANVFWVEHGKIFTPALSEGCVAGVMRRWLLERFSQPGYAIKESVLEAETLLNADEVFLTNAVYGMRWIKSFRKKQYDNKTSRELYAYLGQEIL